MYLDVAFYLYTGAVSRPTTIPNFDKKYRKNDTYVTWNLLWNVKDLFK